MDWPKLMRQLEPVKRQWDVAVLAHLADGAQRPTPLRRIINTESGDRDLNWKVLTETLRRLEDKGYIAREEIPDTQRGTLYRLLPPGRRLLQALDRLSAWYDTRWGDSLPDAFYDREERAEENRMPDVTKPNIARVYDYLLGGKEHFAPDREMAERLLAADPDVQSYVRDNRAFVCAAAARAARDSGISQFLDLGSGLPAHPAVHEAVRAENPDARIAYVDLDSVVVAHSRALLATGQGLAAFAADLTRPEHVVAEAERAGILDPGQPTGIILGSVAHFLPASVMRATVEAYIAQIKPGSWLIISIGRTEDDETPDLRPAYTAASTYHHTPAEFRSFFGDATIVPPGIVEARQWISGTAAPLPTRGLYVLCGTGITQP